VIERGAVAVAGSEIVAVGPESDLRRRFRARSELDARGGTIVPGFVDAHTHPVFAGTREDEFEMRTAGATYVEIARAGGGILQSVRGVRSSSAQQLEAGLVLRLARFLAHGTTTLEAKSGYGLSLVDEQRCLEAIAAASRAQAVELVPTFLGAHALPEEYQGRRERYVDLLIAEMLPAIAELGLARYCDVFVEQGAFDLAESRRILVRAKELGLGLRLHVDQLSPLGGAELAAELGAESADHLEHVSERGIEAMARAGVIPVLCPLVPLYLRLDQEAPARAMVRSGLATAIATDFNPGSCYLQSMPEVMTWAALRFRFSAAEALTAATLNAACSLGLGGRIGSIEAGKQADLLVLDVPNHKHLCYELGRNPVRIVLKRGRIALDRSSSVG
jgi:imidazolonepropionase